MPADKLKAAPSGKYVITVDHSPLQFDENAAINADLQLSGHIHAAQLFPLRLLYLIALDEVYGDYRFDETTDIYVSSGMSGWGFPLRSEAACNYEVIELIPN